MSYFEHKMRQIRFRLGLHPRPSWGSLQCSPYPLTGFKGPTSKGTEGRGRKGPKGRRSRLEGRGSTHSLTRPLASCTRRHWCIRSNLVLIRPWMDWQSVCLSVCSFACPQAYHRNCSTHAIFISICVCNYLWPWLCPLPAAVLYVVSTCR